MCEGFTFGDRQVGRILPRTLLRGRPFGGYVESSRNPVKQHICCFYWLTRGGEAAAVGLAGGGVLVHKEFPRGRGPILSTQTLSGGRAPDFIYTELAEISFSLFRRVIV